MAFRYEGKIPTMEYKTLRYPGHAQIMEAIRELGLLDLEPVDVKGIAGRAARRVRRRRWGRSSRSRSGKDLVALRVVVEGTKDGAAGVASAGSWSTATTRRTASAR